ncbi:Hypothetical protein NTJ_06124 [Nesidiocoris tenuis]|uniref:Uncharacterized protein n=1 Tax=Nesidiocoris tenuis TaxID=355587 RepID=A0ABN7AQX4_9HEMI|nr:Hypothetical protein NTJ_06124 [Nesidiocoris tenuis]
MSVVVLAYGTCGHCRQIRNELEVLLRLKRLYLSNWELSIISQSIRLSLNIAENGSQKLLKAVDRIVSDRSIFRKVVRSLRFKFTKAEPEFSWLRIAYRFPKSSWRFFVKNVIYGSCGPKNWNTPKPKSSSSYASNDTSARRK